MIPSERVLTSLQGFFIYPSLPSPSLPLSLLPSLPLTPFFSLPPLPRSFTRVRSERKKNPDLEECDEDEEFGREGEEGRGEGGEGGGGGGEGDRWRVFQGKLMRVESSLHHLSQLLLVLTQYQSEEVR